MAKFSVIILSTALLVNPNSSAFAKGNSEKAAVTTSQVVAKKLKTLMDKSGFKNSELGLWVGTGAPADPEIIFENNAQKALIPASLSKLVTAGAVIQLHPSLKFKTELLADSPTEKSTLKGPIYLRGGGDPSFVSENMWFLVNEFARNEITTIEGDVVVDDSRFDDIRFSEERESVRVDRAYDAPVGAMSMNWNSVNVYIRPDTKSGLPAKVTLDPMTPYLRLVNNAKTGSPGSGKNLNVERAFARGFSGDVIVVSGKIAMGQPEAVVYKSISQPDLWSAHNLIEFLKQRGITVRGQVRRGITPVNAQVLATSESKPLGQILNDMNKFSNNYVAEMLVKNLAAESGQKPATLAGGMTKIQNYLLNLGLSKDSFSFISPSGFNRGNKLSAQQMGQILEKSQQDFSSFPELLTSLPIAGVDGTLKNRMKGGRAEGWVRAKTGLLNGAVGLAGFAGRADGQVSTFVFIYNGGGREDRARSLFDEMATTLAGEG